MRLNFHGAINDQHFGAAFARWEKFKIQLGVLAVVGLSPLASASGWLQQTDTSDQEPPQATPLQLQDVFEIEFASDPQISPDGTRIVYVRNFMDIQNDRARSNLWIMDRDGQRARPLTSGARNDGSPRWSPSGDRLLYVSTETGSAQIHCRWMDDGHTAVISRLPKGPAGIRWSPDGRHIAFSMFVKEQSPPMIQLPGKPSGADWAEPAIEITDLQYRADGQGYLESGNRHLFTLPIEGGTPRQLTNGKFDHGGDFCWLPDNSGLLFSANRSEDHELNPMDSNLFEVSLADRQIQQLTSRDGPDSNPVISPDGEMIAYLGFDDERQGYQTTQLYVMQRGGGDGISATTNLDRSVGSPRWSSDGSKLYFTYDDLGITYLASLSRQGEIEQLQANLGGTSLGRPYPSGSYSIADDQTLCFTLCSALHPSDVAIREPQGETKRLTHLNDDLMIDRQLGEVEEIWVESSFDGRPVQAWIVKPPQFDPDTKYPLILEIHGGPFLNYGPRFAMELQLYAAAGYVAVYANPRGSTSYGGEFGNLIHHNYPGQDYDDLMSVVDGVIGQGYVDEERLFVTGGSGGGVLTAWIVGKTDRFAGAVVAKPVINWYSFALTADSYNFFYQYWFPGPPWEYPQQYLDRSPLSYVGNVSTPTMLLTGEADYRTPISETEQFYQALQLCEVETAMIRIPGASHGITARPSNLMAKVAYILKWFEMHDPVSQTETTTE